MKTYIRIIAYSLVLGFSVLPAPASASTQQHDYPLRLLDITQSVPYRIVTEHGTPDMASYHVYIHAPDADTFTKRAQTALKAAKDIDSQKPVNLIWVQLVTLPNFALESTLDQAVARYDSQTRTWRAYAYAGPAIPDWRIKVTEHFYEESQPSGNIDSIDMLEFQERIGRLMKRPAKDIQPLLSSEIQLQPYRLNQ